MTFKTIIILVWMAGPLMLFGQENDSKLYSDNQTEFSRAFALVEQGSIDEAESFFRLKLKEGTSEEKLLAFGGLGKVFYFEGRNEEAHQNFQKALQQPPEKNSITEALLLSEIHYLEGLLFEEDFRVLDSAIYHYQESLKIRQSYYGKPHPEIADCYDGLANANRYITFNFNQANNYYLKAIDQRERADEKDERALFYSVYWYIGSLTLNRNLETGLSMVPKLKSLMQGLKGPSKAERFRGNLILGNLYSELEQADKSESYYKKAITAFGKENDPFILNATLNIALIYNGQGKYQESIKLIEEAFARFDMENLYVNDAVIMNYFNLAAAYRFSDQFDKALYNYNKSLQLSIDRYGARNLRTMEKYDRLGDLHQEYERPEEALEYYQKALQAGFATYQAGALESNPVLDKKLARYELAEVFADKGRAWFDLYHKTGEEKMLNYSLESYLKADSLFTWMRTFYQRDDQLNNLEFYQKIYGNAMEVVITLDSLGRSDLEAGLVFLEKNRSILLLSSLKSQASSSDLGIPESLLLKEDSLLQNLDTSKDNFESRLNSPDTSGLQLAAEELSENYMVLLLYQQKIKEEHQNYYDLKYNNDYADLEDVKLYLSKKGYDQAIAYFWGQTQLIILSISEQSIDYHTIPLTKEFSGKVKDLITLMQAPSRYSDLEKDTQNYNELATEISETVLWPLLRKRDSEEINKLLILADGPLQGISFDALFYEKPKEGVSGFSRFPYMVQKYEIAYSFSFNTQILQDKDGTPLRKVKTGVFAYNDGSKLGQDNEIAALPGSFEDLQVLESIFGRDMTGFSGKEASKSNFREKAGEFDILHLSIHGEADTTTRYGSRLLFNPEGNEHDKDERLYLYELYELEIDARLVFLGACETGVGRDMAAEGTMSMGWAFAYTGCPSLVMSLWRLDDQSNPKLVETFYSVVKEGGSISAASRQAKLSYLEAAPDEGLSHPAYWASLIAIGNMDPVMIKSDEKLAKYLILSFLFLSIGITVFMVYRRTIS